MGPKYKGASLIRKPCPSDSTVLRAEGDKQSAILRAEGYALALDKVFQVARTLDANTMDLQYLETLKNLGAGPSTKFIFPMEFASFLKPILNIAPAPPAARVARGSSPAMQARRPGCI
ncbi:MAG: hypothetical protein ACRD4A_02440 [Candidatus Acidiferrales bacterium]